MKKENVGGVPGNVLGMLADLAHKLQHGKITPEELGRFLRRENPSGENFSKSLRDWENFYKEVFGIEVNFSNLEIPDKEKGFDRLIIVAEGMTPQQLYDKCEELFPCWKWTDHSLDQEMVIPDRTVVSWYGIWVRDRLYADVELKNLSANDLRKHPLVCITLKERLLYEIKYFKETGEHLDIANITTLCAGSRYIVGNGVPGVRWESYGSGMLKVVFYIPSRAEDDLRSREVVFL